MKKIKYILSTAACLLTIAGFIVIGKGSFTSVAEASATPTPKNFYAETKPIPEEITYWLLFVQINDLKSKDSEASLQGETTSFKTAFYQNNLGLESSQFSAVDNAVANCLSQIQPIDQQARQIINDYRAQYPNRELKIKQPSQTSTTFGSSFSESPYEKLPPPPAQLQQLQNQKNQVILNAKESIKQALGTSAFTEFDAAVKKDATQVLVPQNLGSRTPEPLQTPSN